MSPEPDLLKSNQAGYCKITVLICTYFYLTAAVISASAQSVRVLSTKDGLPQSFVSGLVQDDYGFVWIGTRNGLARYDGVRCKVFQHDLHDSTTLSANVIVWINKDRHNYLWIRYESGDMDGMDPVTERISHIKEGNPFKGRPEEFVRRSWLVDQKGEFWGIVKSGGLANLDASGRSLKQYGRNGNNQPGDTPRALLEDRNGIIWVTGYNTISRLDRQTQAFTHWAFPFKPAAYEHANPEDEAIDLHERRNGELMWGDRERLIFFNPLSHSFRTLALPAHSVAGIKWIRTGPDGLDYFELENELYCYGETKGLVPIGTALMNHQADARSFLVDRSGLIWIGTNAGGLHQVDLMIPFFRSFPYKEGFHEDLLRQELGWSLVRLFNWDDRDQHFSASGYHFRSAYDSRQRLWMGLKERIGYYDPSTKTCKLLPPIPFVNDPAEQDIPLKGLTFTRDGAPLVIGYNGQLFLYDSSHKAWLPFIESDRIRKSFGLKLLPQDMLDDGQTIWITTANDGLLYMDVLNRKIRQLKENAGPGSLPTNQLLGCLADPSRPDLLWIGSYQGLICLNKKTLKSEVFSLEEGLPDNTIYSIQADHWGNLWFSTNKGLCQFDPITHRIRGFRTPNGLPGDEFNRFHHLKLPDGRLAFGGTDGWTLFDPIPIKKDDFDPVIAFTNLKINNTTVNPDRNNPILPYPLNAIPKLNLSYDQNVLSIEYAGLEFNQPQDLVYRYRLTGYDDDWIPAGHSQIANYTRVPPGHYTLKVNASNSSGRWSSHVKTLEVVIAAPWWQSWWAYFCYGLILASIIWAYMRYRIKRELLRQEMNLKEKEATQFRELDEMKTRFFANVTHEFRTPLTLIMGPARQLKDLHHQDPRQERLAGIIEKNAEEMLNLINQLMDLSKLEARALKPQERRGSVLATVGTVIASFENEARDRNIRLVPDLPETGTDYWFAAEALERIVYNLLSNALKFTPEGGRVEVSLSTGPEGIELEVRDTGGGIAADEIPFIFDRFYQGAEGLSGLSPERTGQEGTGIGLALVKELVEVQGGTIEVQSRKDLHQQDPQKAGSGPTSSGTVFTVLLPYRPALPPEQTDAAAAEGIPGETDKRCLILLVEDNADLAGYIKDSLSGAYRVQHADNGSSGLKTALEIMPDLILSDVLMPVMDGYELCENLKKDLRTSHIPMILLTAKATQDHRIEGLSRGADDYLTKPFHPSELMLRIHNQLEQRSRLREQLRKEMRQCRTPETKTTESGKPGIRLSDPFLEKVYRIVEEHLDDPLFGVEELVTRLDMGRTSLHRKVKAMAGLSTSELVRNYRLKRAAEFLQQGQGSAQAAYLSGFGSPAYFTRCFRELYGITPGEFVRQRQRGG